MTTYIYIDIIHSIIDELERIKILKFYEDDLYITFWNLIGIEFDLIKVGQIPPLEVYNEYKIFYNELIKYLDNYNIKYFNDFDGIVIFLNEEDYEKYRLTDILDDYIIILEKIENDKTLPIKERKDALLKQFDIYKIKKILLDRE